MEKAELRDTSPPGEKPSHEDHTPCPTQDRTQAEDQVRAAQYGVVHRHIFRGQDYIGKKEERRAQDDECAAGLRNAAEFEEQYDKLNAVMSKLAPIISKAIEESKGSLKHLHKACGTTPPKPPLHLRKPYTEQ